MCHTCAIALVLALTLVPSQAQAQSQSSADAQAMQWGWLPPAEPESPSSQPSDSGDPTSDSTAPAPEARIDHDMQGLQRFLLNSAGCLVGAMVGGVIGGVLPLGIFLALLQNDRDVLGYNVLLVGLAAVVLTPVTALIGGGLAGLIGMLLTMQLHDGEGGGNRE